MGLKNYKYEIKSKLTIFNGVTYRSRLESEWAVFLTWLGLDFEYESITFDLTDGRKYTPDFRVKLNSFDEWVMYEIKPVNFGEDERVERLNDILKKNCEGFFVQTVRILRGSPHDFFRHYSDGDFSSGDNYVCPCCGDFSCYSVDIDCFECTTCDMNTPSGGLAPFETGLQNKYLVQPHKGIMYFMEDQEYAFNWYKHTVLSALDYTLDWRRINQQF